MVMGFRRKSLKLLSACLVAFSCLLFGWIYPADSQNSNAIWIWSGAVTTDSAVVKARLRSGISQASIHINPAEDSSRAGTMAAEIHADADSDGIVIFRLVGLQSNKEYRYTIEADGKLGPAGRFHTLADGPMSFRIGFASCATTGSNHRIFTTLEDLRPLFFIHMGDFHYEDIERNDPSLFIRAYDRVLSSPRQGAFYRSTPVAYVYDDHDFGPDDADGTSPSKPAALKTYQQCVPHYPLSRSDRRVHTIQQAFTVGRVRFLMLDVRSERTPADEPDGSGKTMLGKRQLEWLHEELLEAQQRYALVVLVNGVPWITRNSSGKEHGWEPYSHERTVVADMIKEAKLVNRLIMLSGDGHMVAIDDGTNSNYASDRAPDEEAFPVIQAAPLDRYPRIKGGPYSHGAFAPYRWLRILKARQFGLMELEDDGNRLQIQLSCRNADGKILKNLVLKIACDQDGCKVI
jgi:phosphodiesterase/alkaline phosphatase D-like protein